MADDDELPRQRFRLLLQQLREEADGERGGWQQQVADQLGISQGLVSKIARGERDPGLATIEKAKKRLKVHHDFFNVAGLKNPHYRDFPADRARRPTEPAPDDPPFWRDFLANYDRIDELDPEDLETMRSFGFKGRRGIRIRSWTDWAVLADWVLNRKPSRRFESAGE